MRKIEISFLIILCLPFLISCQKELSMDSSLGGNSPTLQGKWKFIGMQSKTEAIVELSDGIDVLKTITLSDYGTTQNTGTLDIGASNVVSTGFGYEVNAVAKGYFFENNILVDSAQSPFNFIAPPTNSAATYTRVNSDSLTFGPGFVSIGGSTTPTTPTGARIQFQADKLLMTVGASKSNVQTILGMTQTTREAAKVVMTFQRQ